MSGGVSSEDTEYLKSLGVFSASRTAIVMVRSGLLLLVIASSFWVLQDFWSGWSQKALPIQCAVGKMSLLSSRHCLEKSLHHFATIYERHLWLYMTPDNSLLLPTLVLEKLVNSGRNRFFAALFLDQGVKALLVPAILAIFLSLVGMLIMTKFSLRFTRRSPYADDFGHGYRLPRLVFTWFFITFFFYWWLQICVPLGYATFQMSLSSRDLVFSSYANVLMALGGTLIGVGIGVQVAAFAGYRLRYAKVISSLRRKHGG